MYSKCFYPPNHLSGLSDFEIGSHSVVQASLARTLISDNFFF